MKKNQLKPHVIRVGESKRLSAAVCRELEERGAENSGTNSHYPEIVVRGNSYSGDGGGWKHRTPCPVFDAATQFGEWLAFLDEPTMPEVEIWNVTTKINQNGSACLRFNTGELRAVFLQPIEIDALYAASQAARGIEPAKPAEFDKVAYLENLRSDYRESPLGFDDFIGQRLAAEKANQAK